MASKWDVKGSRLTLTSLQVTQQFPKGWKAKILCKGAKCPFKSKNLKAGKVSKGASTIISVALEDAAQVPGRTNGRGLGQRAELQHQGRATGAEDGQDPHHAAVLRVAGPEQAAEDLRLSA